MRVRQSIYIERAPDEVFAFIADHDNDVLWRTELDSSEFLGESRQGVGARIRQVFSYQGRSADLSFEVTDFIPERRICFRAHGGLRAHGCYDVAADGDGAMLKVSMTLELKGEEMMLERYLRQALESTVSADLARLKSVLESPPGTRPS
jgi:uncharacterized membrane protein